MSIVKGATKLCFTYYPWLVIVLFNTGYKSLHFLPISWKTSFLSVPSGHRTSFGRSMDVYMKSGLHIDVHGMSKGRLMSTGSAQNLFKKFKKTKLYFGNLILAAL